MTATFDDVKVGDEVVVVRGREIRRASISAVTPKQVVVGSVRYWRKDGVRVGEKSDCTVWGTTELIQKMTPELEARLARQELAKRYMLLRDTERPKMTNQELQDIIGIWETALRRETP